MASMFSSSLLPSTTNSRSFLHHHSASPVILRPTRTLAIPADADPAAAVAVIGTAGAAIAAAVSISDPERRRRNQAEVVGGDDKEVVREYFNKTGFERWRKIYGEGDDVNKVQQDIRLGHARTVENTLTMLRSTRPLVGVTVCDAGCGTGSLSIPLAADGALVSASDISAAMVDEARRKAQNALPPDAPLPNFEVSDLEGLSGRYDMVVCLDVLIHYPQNKADGMIAHLASLAEKRLVLSFAPKTLYYDVLKRIGELFPGPSKATRAYLHAEKDVEMALEKVGWKVSNKGLVTSQFYFSSIIEAVPATS